MIECKKCRDDLAEYVLDQYMVADDVAKSEMQEHLRQCASCRDELDEIVRVYGLFATSLDPQPVSSQFEQRVMRGLSATAADSPTTVTSESAATTRGFWESTFWRYAVAVSVLLALMFSYYQFRAGPTEIDGSLTQEEVERIELLARQMGKLRELQQFDEKMKYVSFFDTAVNSRVSGYLVYDLVGQQAHFFCVDAARPAEGAGYVVWLLDELGRPLASERVELTETPDGLKGTATVVVRSDFDLLRSAIVTLEPVDKLLVEPTGSPKMRASIDF